MRFAILLIFVVQACCLAADDPGVLAAGDWSDPVHDPASGVLRGRLLLCESPKDKSPAVYIELQECSTSWGRDLDVYCNLLATFTRGPAPGTKKTQTVKGSAVWEMRDGSGQLVPQPPSAFSGGAPGEQWIALPCDATVRLRASAYVKGRLEDGSLNIFFLGNHWEIPARSTNDYFLSCTFTVEPPANHATLPGHFAWHGTLKLPDMKLPVQKP